MLTVFIYSLMCYGISSALVYYNGPFGVLSRFRNIISGNSYLNELFSCMFCLPTNIGFVMSALSMLLASTFPFTPFTILFSGHLYLWPLIIIFDGFFTGAVVSIMDTIIDRISTEKLTIDNSNNIDANKILLND